MFGIWGSMRPLTLTGCQCQKIIQGNSMAHQSGWFQQYVKMKIVMVPLVKF